MQKTKNCKVSSPLKTAYITPNAESLEEKIKKLMTSGSPIESVAPQIFTERKDGVIAGYDCRTDRFEVALDASTVVDATLLAQREERIKAQEEQTKTE